MLQITRGRKFSSVSLGFFFFEAGDDERNGFNFIRRDAGSSANPFVLHVLPLRFHKELLEINCHDPNPLLFDGI